MLITELLSHKYKINIKPYAFCVHHKEVAKVIVHILFVLILKVSFIYKKGNELDSLMSTDKKNLSILDSQILALLFKY